MGDETEAGQIVHATLVSWSNVTYLAVVQLGRSPDTTIAGVPVSRAISAMTAGQVVALLLFDPNNSSDAMIVGNF